MKEIKAILQPYKLDDVLLALSEIEGLPAATVSECRVVAPDDPERATPKIRLELVLEDIEVDRVVRAIANAARTGLAGDGRILVMPIERTVLIREASPDPGMR